MSEKVYPVKADWAKGAWIDDAKYQELYKRSVTDPNGFWGEAGKRLDWIKPYTRVKNTSFDPGNVSIKWFEDGTLNLSANCIDRHLATRGDQVAIIWESDDPTLDEQITYNQLHERVCRFANVLKAHGVKKGDRVTIYLPMIPEAAYAMLACARIGAIHSIVFGGFSPDSLKNRVDDAESRVIITADESVRGGKNVPLKKNADIALEGCHPDTRLLVVRRTGNPINWVPGRDFWMHEETAKVAADCPPEEMNAEDPLFILYTSGSTGKPKGVVHTTGGYLLYASMTHQYVFDYHDGDIYWCTADVGWVTGHSYIVYGPLANGATTLMFEGIPTYPDRLPFLARRRQVEGQYLLHRADRDPVAHGPGRRLREAHEPCLAARLGFRWRADQPGSMGVVLQRRGRSPLPHRRYVVADGNRRHSHHAAARRHSPEAGLGDASLLRRAARPRR